MQNQTKTNGLLSVALLALGSFAVWQNRFAIQKFLEARGIKTDWMTGSASDAVKSGVAKISGAAEHGAKKFSDGAKQLAEKVKPENLEKQVS